MSNIPNVPNTMTYVRCKCHTCGYTWTSEGFPGVCPRCGSDEIDQISAMNLR